MLAQTPKPISIFGLDLCISEDIIFTVFFLMENSLHTAVKWLLNSQHSTPVNSLWAKQGLDSLNPKKTGVHVYKCIDMNVEKLLK